jgi:hypothetical protein
MKRISSKFDWLIGLFELGNVIGKGSDGAINGELNTGESIFQL